MHLDFIMQKKILDDMYNILYEVYKWNPIIYFNGCILYINLLSSCLLIYIFIVIIISKWSG